MRTSRLDTFTAAIRFFELPPPASQGRGLAPSWQKADLEEALGEAGWTLISDLTWYELRGGVRDLCFARGEEVVTLTIFVTSAGEAAAREWFLVRAATTSVPEIPFRRSELALGQLAVETYGPLQREILWLFHNLVFHMRAIGTEISLTAVAERLQQRAASAEDPHDLTPDLPQVATVAPPAKGKIGQILRVPLLLQPPADLLQRYEVEVNTEGKAIDFVGFEGNKALFELQRAGVDRFTINVIDRRTLLSNRIEAEVEVEPDALADSDEMALAE